VTPLWRLYNSVSAVKYLWVAAHIVFVECSGVKIAAKVRLLSDNYVLIENLSTSWMPVLTEILSYTYSQQAEVFAVMPSIFFRFADRHLLYGCVQPGRYAVAQLKLLYNARQLVPLIFHTHTTVVSCVICTGRKPILPKLWERRLGFNNRPSHHGVLGRSPPCREHVNDVLLFRCKSSSHVLGVKAHRPGLDIA
jgi:hypothetical protein